MNVQKEIIDSLKELNVAIAELKTERDMLLKENEYLKSLVHHLASRPTTYTPVPSQPDSYAPPFVVTC